MWPNQKDVAQFYGNPDKNTDGTADVEWENENLVYLKPQYAMVLSWDITKPLSKMRVHKKVEADLGQILAEIGALGTKFIQKNQLDRFGGAYNFRLMRGGSKLSMHSYGCALDLSPERNPYHKKWDPKTMMPKEVVDIFKAHGWAFGGDWSDPDAMHFQAAEV